MSTLQIARVAFIVWVHTGEYEDYRRNVYKICLTLQSAQECEARLVAALGEIGLDRGYARQGGYDPEEGPPEPTDFRSRNVGSYENVTDEMLEGFPQIDVLTGMGVSVSEPFELEP